MTSKIHWYNPIGDDAHTKLAQKHSEFRLLTGKPKGDGTHSTGVLVIRKKNGLQNLFEIRSIMFHAGGEDNLTRNISTGELRTMFNMPRDRDEHNDPEYAALYGAQFGIPGLFIRADDLVSFPNPGNGLPRDPNFCFRLKEFMGNALENLIRTGRTGLI